MVFPPSSYDLYFELEMLRHNQSNPDRKSLDLYLYAGRSMSISHCMIVLYSRDHKGVGVAHEKPASIFPDDDEAVLVS